MVAVVILNYNGRSFLERFLPSVMLYSTEAEVYLADNFSSDDSVAYVEKTYGDRIKTIKLPENYGFAEGYNQALRQINSKYYLLLNSDVEVTAGWLTPLLALINSHENIGAVQPKILAEHARNTFEYAGASGGFMDALGYPLCRGRIFDTAEPDSGQYDDEIECFWATGAAMLVRSDIYHAIGGLDGDFFAHMEEIDWCWRIKQAGYQVMVAPKSVVFHVGGGTLTKQNPRKTYLNFRNSLVTLLKNEKTSKLLWLFPTRLILDGVAGLKFLLDKKPADVYMIVLAHWFVFLHIFSIVKKRKQTRQIIEKNRIASDNSQTGALSISSIWAYFIQKKQTYQQLIKR